MRVKLLKNVLEDGRLKVSIRSEERVTPFVKDAVIEMSDASGQKYIDAGLAEVFVPPPAPEPDPTPAEPAPAQ